MKESAEKENQVKNQIHLNGFMNRVFINELESGKTSILVNLSTYEAFKNDAGETQKKYTRHDVNFVTDDAKLIKNFEAIEADLKENREHRDEEDFKPKTHTLSCDGKITIRPIDEGKDYKVIISGDADSLAIDKSLDMKNKEKRNSAQLEGIVAAVKVYDDMAIVRVANHYYAPGESENYKGEKKPYKEMTSFIDTRVSANFRSKIFEEIKNGAIAKGDTIKVYGQLHNNNFGEEDNMHYHGVIDVRKCDMIRKASKKEAQAEAQSNDVKEAPKKKVVKAKAKGRTM